MSEKETESTTESVVEEIAVETSAVEGQSRKIPVVGYATAVVLVVAIIFGVLYSLEKEGRSSTNIFASVIASQEAKAVVAVVNGKEIINSDLTISAQQFSQAAAAQGVDVVSPESQTEIRSQALEVLINTELLKQEAKEKGISVSEEDVSVRLQSIEAEIGGAEVLAERMEALGLSTEKLESDIEDELLIQQLLDTVFAAAEIEVTDEEIAGVYESAGGEEAGLPALEEVRAQVEEQIRGSKEQAAIDEYLSELKDGAEVEIKEV